MGIYIFANDQTTANVANSDDQIFGSNANNTVNIFSGVTGLTLDQNIETVQLTGAASDYRYKQSGNQLEVYAANGTTLITRIPLQGDADGTGIQFGSSAVVSAVLSDTGVMTLGGSTVSATTVGAVTPGAGGGGGGSGQTFTKFTLTEDETSGNYSSVSNGVVVTLDGDDDAADGTIFSVVGSSSDDTLVVDKFREFTFNAGEGTDTIDLTELSTASTLNFLTGFHKVNGTTTNGTMTSVENVILSDNGDTVTGDNGANVVTLNDGTDTVSLQGGDDVFVVSDEDNLDGDTLTGGAGTDTIRVTTAALDADGFAANVTVASIEAVEFTTAVELKVDDGTKFDLSSFATLTFSSGADSLEISGNHSLDDVVVTGLETITFDAAALTLTIDNNTFTEAVSITGDATAKDNELLLAGSTGAVYDLTNLTIANIDTLEGTSGQDTVILNQSFVDALTAAENTSNSAAIFSQNNGFEDGSSTTYWDTLQASGNLDLTDADLAGAELAFKKIDFGTANTIAVNDLANSTVVVVAGTEGTSDVLLVDMAATAQDLTSIDIDGVETLIFDATSGTDVTIDEDIINDVSAIVGEIDLIEAAGGLTQDLSGISLTGVTDLQGEFKVGASTVSSLTAAGVGAAATLVLNGDEFDMSSIATATTGLTVTGTSNGDTITGAKAAATYNLGSGNDVFVTGTGSTTNVNTVNGEAGADNITGGKGADIIDGGADADTIVGAAGADTITGGAGADTIDLGSDTDADKVTYSADGDAGSAGVLAASQGDTVTNFTSGTDDLRFIGDYLFGELTGTIQAGTNDIAYGAGIDFDAAGSGDDHIHIIGSGTKTPTVSDLFTLADLNSAIGTLANDDVADERVLIFNSGDGNAAVYKFTSVTADAALTADELQLLGVVDSNIAAADIVIV